MLKVSRGLSVEGYHCPSIGKHLNVFVSQIYHWLDRNHQTLSQDRSSTRFAVIWYLRLFVHGTANAVAAVVLYNREAKWLDIRLHRVADIPKPVSDVAFFDRSVKGLLRRFKQPLHRFTNLADRNSHRSVSHVSHVGRAAIDTHDIAFAQLPLAGDPMHDLIIYRGANRARISVIAFEGGIGTSTHNHSLRLLIQIPSRYARLDHCPQALQDLRDNEPRCSHSFDFRFRFSNDHRATIERKPEIRLHQRLPDC